jgi:phenylalanyl-tRNA synthetase beta subunit
LVNEKASNSIHLINPLITDYSTLRTSLLPKLIQTVGENLKQSNNILEGFEYGHVFSGDIKSNYTEKEVVSGIFGGLKSNVNGMILRQHYLGLKQKERSKNYLKN